MARIGWREGMELAEREAWRTKGKNHASLFVYGRFIPWVLGAVVLGALGFGAKHAWDRLVGALQASSTDTPAAAAAHSGIPGWVWIAGIVLLIVTAVGVRGWGDRFRSFTEVSLTVVGLIIAWIAFAAFVIGAM